MSRSPERLIGLCLRQCRTLLSQDSWTITFRCRCLRPSSKVWSATFAGIAILEDGVQEGLEGYPGYNSIKDMGYIYSSLRLWASQESSCDGRHLQGEVPKGGNKDSLYHACTYAKQMQNTTMTYRNVGRTGRRVGTHSRRTFVVVFAGLGNLLLYCDQSLQHSEVFG